MSANMDRVATFVRELADLIAQDLEAQLGVEAARADQFGLKVAQRFCDVYAGLLIYVPMSIYLRIDERDREMYAEYSRNGRDAGAVAQKFDVCLQTAYKRIRLVETSLFKDRQGELFEEKK